MELEFGDFLFKPEIRKASDLKPVLAFPEKLTSDFEAYYMFRDIYETEEDRKKIIQANLRYDFTIIPPAEIGKEKVKTYGHYHPENSHGETYPEIYQVIEGKALFIIQRRERDRVIDCVVIEAGEGDLVVVPPNFGHVTINPTDEVLLTSNWVCRSFVSIYEPYTNLRGACYYYVDERWIKNPNYNESPPLKYGKPFGKMKEEMYCLVAEIEKLEFLSNPSRYSDVITKFWKK
ncbi:MAG: glucose-6-phosphate isomerase family protein [Archaeoglobaceae archaeon]|uniref:glucose-6-phosphate isomerase n=1 Tax=Archaeoglobus fulgidus TaxID=2234 RepID=A0A7J3M0J5_ARCFL